MPDEPDDNELLLDTPLDEQNAEPADTDDISIEIDGDDAAEETPLIKQLRGQLIEANRRAAEASRSTQPQQPPPDPGKEPDLWEDCEGDAERYKRELMAWNDRTRAVAAHQQKQQEQQQATAKSFERARAGFLARAAKVRDVNMEEAEQSVAQTLSPEWVGAIIESSPVSERVIAALHKYPQEMQKVLEQPADWRRMRALWDLEQKVSKPVPTRTRPPEPEADTIQRGSAPLSQPNADKQLEKLEKEAERTGDRTKIIAFKRAQKEKAK